MRKMATGIASFIFEKWPKGATAAKQITLGRCGDWTVDQARAKARQLAVDFSSPDYFASKVIKVTTRVAAQKTSTRWQYWPVLTP